jgi:hypothetical protein
MTGSACAISAISFLVMALPKELKFSATATNAPAPPMRSTRSKAWVGGSPSCSCHQRGSQEGSQSAHYGDTVLHCEQHHEAFIDNDSSIDIVGERLGLLRGTAAELGRPGQSPHR